MSRKTYEIISAPVVEWLRTQEFPLPEPPIRYYPDGSLWTDDQTVLQWVCEERIAGRVHREVQAVQQLIHHKMPGAYGCCSYRPIAAIGGHWKVTPHYELTYPGSYGWLLKEFSELVLAMYPGIFADVTEEEYDLNCVRVLVRFYQKVTAERAEGLARALRTWFADVGSKGVFGEAGLASISSTLRYRGREAGFELDARGSGQETLNTLYLAILNWGMAERRPLSLIHLGAARTEPVFASGQTASLR